jgi:CMP-N-acetylneuraminic acid synthetase
MQHALVEAERHYGAQFDVLIIAEPTSPLRRPDDIERACRRLLSSGADAVVTVSVLSPKSHPRKILLVEDGCLRRYLTGEPPVTSRQQLSATYYWANGVCYALTRNCVMEKAAIFTDSTYAEIIDRPVVNIDEPVELGWAEFLATRTDWQR